MCDYSLQGVRSRPAKVGDKLVTRVRHIQTEVGDKNRRIAADMSRFRSNLEV